jgi:hypothetical protein
MILSAAQESRRRTRLNSYVEMATLEQLAVLRDSLSQLKLFLLRK